MNKKFNQVQEKLNYDYLLDSSNPYTSYPNSPDSQSPQKPFILKLV